MFLFRNPILKTLLLAVGVTAPACVMAYVGNPAFNGYYGGLNGGIMQTNAKLSVAATSTFQNYYDPDNQLAISQQDVNRNRYTGTGALIIGFGHFINNSNFYLAGEIFGNWADRDTTLNIWSYHQEPNDDEDYESLTTSTSINLKHAEYGVDIRPGYLFDTNTLVFARIGLAFNQITNKTGSDFPFTNLNVAPSVTYDSSINQSKSSNKTALRLGVGVEHMITDRIAITADYIYTYYGKVNTSGVTNTTTISDESNDPFINVDGLVVSSSGKISTQAAMLGIKYYFLPVC